MGDDGIMEKFVLQFCNIFFEGRSLVQRENYPLMEGVMTLYRVLGCQVHVEIAGFLGLVFDDGWCQLIHERWPRVYRCSVEHPKFSLFIVVSYWSTCTFDCLCMGVHLKIHQDTVDIASDHQLKDSLVMIYLQWFAINLYGTKLCWAGTHPTLWWDDPREQGGEEWPGKVMGDSTWQINFWTWFYVRSQMLKDLLDCWALSLQLVLIGMEQTCTVWIPYM